MKSNLNVWLPMCTILGVRYLYVIIIYFVIICVRLFLRSFILFEEKKLFNRVELNYNNML